MNAITQNIKHVVVLMFENRSFDHVFGAFPGANGVLDQNGNVKPECYNLADPTQPSGPSNQIFRPMPIDSGYELSFDYNHSFGAGMMQELFGPGTTGWQAGQPVNAPKVTHPSTNSGFIFVNGKSPDAMSYYRHGTLKVLHTLASEFVLCDNWFCDAPADTLLNRYFMHTAQTGGILTDNQWGPSANINVPTIFNQITQQKSTWKMYAMTSHVDSSYLFEIENSPFTNRPITEFATDAAAGTLPFYSFLMCWSHGVDTSMHPDSDIRAGENYLAAVYNCLRNSPSWSDTLLIVTFDENGGMYDHVFPPTATPPQPGVITDPVTGCTFDYTLLGPRIPALFISPWLRNGIAKGQYQNTSILRFLQGMIEAKQSLTGRDGNAPPLDPLFKDFGLSQPRADCPLSMPTYPGFPFADGDLSKPPTMSARANIAPPPYAAEVARIYGHSL